MNRSAAAAAPIIVSAAVGLVFAIMAGLLATLIGGGVEGIPASKHWSRMVPIAIAMTVSCLKILGSKTPDGHPIPSFDPGFGVCIVLGVLGGSLCGAVVALNGSSALRSAIAIVIGAILGLVVGLLLRPVAKLAFGRIARRSGDGFDGALIVASGIAAIAGHLGGASRIDRLGAVDVLGVIAVSLAAIGFVIAAVRDFQRASWIERVANRHLQEWSIVPNEERLMLGSYVDGVGGDDHILMRAPAPLVPAAAGSPFRSPGERPTPVALVDRTGKDSAKRARIRGAAAITAAIVIVVFVPATIQLVIYVGPHLPDRSSDYRRPAPVAALDAADDITSMSIGGAVGCARRANGMLWCWGSWPAEYLGVSSKAKPMTTLGPVTEAFTVGDRRICAVPDRGDHRAVCWGVNYEGQLGDGKKSPNRGPEPVGPPDVVELATGASFSSVTIARTKDGRVWQWGYDSYEERELRQREGEQAQLPTTPRLIEGISDVVQIAAGRNHACALDRAGAVFCWGVTYYGQTGWKRKDPDDGKRPPSYMAVPARVEGLPATIDRLVLGGDASAAHRKKPDNGNNGNHEWFAWGHRLPWGSGQKMSRHPDGAGEVDVIPGTEQMQSLKIGWNNGCGLFDDGSVRCWGDGQQGSLGDGRIESGEHPMSTPVPSGVHEISGDEHGTCARRTRGVLCWGFP